MLSAPWRPFLRPPSRQLARRITFLLAAYAFLGSLLTLLGWAFGVNRLTDWVGDNISMKPNAALWVLCCGLGLMLLSLNHPKFRHASAALGASAALIGLLTLFEHVSGRSLGIDTLLFTEPPGARATIAPGRMGLPASTTAVVVGVGLLAVSTFSSAARARHFAPALGLATIGVTMLSISGYLLGSQQLYTIPPVTGIAVQTASMIMALGAALVAATPERQPMRTLVESGAGARLALRDLPMILVLPVVLSWLLRQGVRLGLYDVPTGDAFLVVALWTCLCGLLWWCVSGIRAGERELREHEELLAGMLGSMTDGLVILDRQWRFVFANDQALAMFDRSRSYLAGRTSWEVFPSAGSQGQASLMHAAETNSTTEFQEFDPRTQRWFGCKAYPTTNRGMALSFEDISERKQAEEIRARLAAIVQSSDDAIVSKDVNGIITSWNAGAERLFGYTSQEAVGQSITILIPRNRLDEEADILERLRRGERLEHFETVRRRKDGSQVYVSLTVSPILDSSGAVIGASKIARDITERRRAQAALLVKERQLRHIADNTAVMIAQCTRDLRYAFVNRACADFLERRADEIVGRRIPEIIGDSAFESIRPHIDRVLRGERVEFDTEIEYATIGRRCVRVVYVPDTGPDGGVCGWIAAVSDLTDRRKAERDLEASEQRYRSLVSVITDVPWAADAQGAFMSPQVHWSEYTGQTWEQMKGFGWAQALHPDDRDTARATWEDAKREGAMYESGARLWHAATRRYRHVVVRATPIRDDNGAIQEWVGACTDVDDQVRARERLEAIVAERTAELKASMMQLQAAGRLAALGNMAAGLGHDIANMVLPIRSRLELLHPMCHTEEARADLVAIDKSLTHLTNLSAGLRLMALDPARGGASSPVTDLAEWWFETQGVLRGVLPSSVRLAIDIEPSLAGVGVAMPRHQLTQAVFNLVQNSGEALSGQDAGSVMVSLRPAPARKDRDMILITIADNGPGIAPENLERCFEPYFSTKGRAIATGMGLGMARGMIESAGGSIAVRSDPGEGAVFSLTVPALRRTPAPASVGDTRPLTAAITLTDAHAAGLAHAMLRGMRIGIAEHKPELGPPDADLWVAQSPAPGVITNYLAGSRSRRVVLVGEAPVANADGDRVFHLSPSVPPSMFRATLARAARGESAGSE